MKNAKTLLKVEGLKFQLNGKNVLDGVNLTINRGEIHAILGPNGSGKSTFAKILAGHPFYKIKEGKIFFKGKSTFNLSPDEIARSGLFLAFQQPLEFNGITNFDFFKMLNETHFKKDVSEEPSPFKFYDSISPLLEKFNLPKDTLSRNLNENFSGGEKKKVGANTSLCAKTGPIDSG